MDDTYNTAYSGSVDIISIIMYIEYSNNGGKSYSVCIADITLCGEYQFNMSWFQILDQVSPKPEEVKCSQALRFPKRNREDCFLPG